MHADLIERFVNERFASTPDAARRIGLLAVRSLHTELRLYPKPGLVTPLDNGSHRDMTADTFLRSVFALRHYFVQIAQAGKECASFEVFRELGIAAERTMMRATGGINTHRGAIFSVGMMAAAIAAASAVNEKNLISPRTIQQALLQHWGAALQCHARAMDQTDSLLIVGARAEAAHGFPALFELALPTLRRSLARNRSWHHACIDTLFALIAHLDDTNILHRGGPAGAAEARALAQQFIDAGATNNRHWERHAAQISERFVALNLSPGGAADLLAATCLVHWASLPQGSHA